MLRSLPLTKGSQIALQRGFLIIPPPSGRQALGRDNISAYREILRRAFGSFSSSLFKFIVFEIKRRSVQGLGFADDAIC